MTIANNTQHWHLVRPKSDLPQIRETMALRLNVNCCLLAQPQTHPATASATGCVACRVPLRRGRGRRERSVKISGLGQLFQFSSHVGVAHQLWRARVEKHQVLQKRIESAQKIFHLVPAFGSSPETLGKFEKLAVISNAR